MKYIVPNEAIKRLAAAQGIDYLNLVKTPEEVQSEDDDMLEDQQRWLTKQMGQLASAPMMDPSKNTELLEQPMEGAHRRIY